MIYRMRMSIFYLISFEDGVCDLRLKGLRASKLMNVKTLAF